MAYKPLPEQSHLLKLFRYDHETGQIYRNTQSGNSKINQIAGHTTKRGYRKVNVNGQLFFVHRLAWKMFYGEDPKDQIDHINRDKADNRICNLRDVSQSVNNKNKKSPRDSSHVGVYYNKSKKKWQARLEIHVGWFDCEDEAIAQRERAIKEIFEALGKDYS